MKAKMSALADAPPAFTFRRAVLDCDSVPMPRLADEFGTPLYVYSGSTIRRRFRAFDHAFKDIPHTICYSVKANSNLAILRLLASEGAGFDVVSGGELQRVARAHKPALRKVVFSGVGKTVAEMELALKAGILMFNLESESELRALAERARKLKKSARIALRVNPDVSAQTHPYIATGLQQHKFGVPFEAARELYRQAADEQGLEVAGISAHIGSQITEVLPFSAAMTLLGNLVRSLRAEGHTIAYLDAGGGLGIPYNHSHPARNSLPAKFADQVNSYAQAISRPLRDLDLHLLLEPGRAIVGPAGALLTRVLYVKSNGDKRFIVVDAAMNDLIRPSLYGAHHDIVPLARTPSPVLSPADVVGPICETGDFFARARSLPQVREGDLLAILDTGAYGMSISSNYNTRLRAAEVLVEGAAVRQIRRRESFSDLIRNEVG